MAINFRASLGLLPLPQSLNSVGQRPFKWRLGQNDFEERAGDKSPRLPCKLPCQPQASGAGVRPRLDNILEVSMMILGAVN